jgi:transcriptional regulator with XRE-family HTH domain
MTTSDARRRRELREFLVTRRAGITPESVGLPSGRRRRTPGLRREELATVAGVGVTWYTWLEQGRDIRVSADTLERIADALRLTSTDRAYLFSLAAVPRPEVTTDGTLELDPGIQRALDAFQAPAFVLGPCWDVEAFNEIADRLYAFRDHSDPFWRNHVWRFFMDPARRDLYMDWNDVAEVTVGALRSSYARRMWDADYERLVSALAEGSATFKRLWKAQRTAPLAPDPVRLRVPGSGEVHVTSIRLQIPGRDEFVLFLLPPTDAQSAGVLARLADPRSAHLRRTEAR